MFVSSFKFQGEFEFVDISFTLTQG